MSIGASVSCALRFDSLVGVRIRNLGPSERYIFSSSIADCAPILGRFARLMHTLIRRQSSHSLTSANETASVDALIAQSIAAGFALVWHVIVRRTARVKLDNVRLSRALTSGSLAVD